MTPLLCACTVVITLETQNKCRKKAPCFVEFNFFTIALSENGFRRMKEEGQSYKKILFNFHTRCPSTFSIPWCKKGKKWPKLKSRGSPALKWLTLQHLGQLIYPVFWLMHPDKLFWFSRQWNVSFLTLWYIFRYRSWWWQWPAFGGTQWDGADMWMPSLQSRMVQKGQLITMSQLTLPTFILTPCFLLYRLPTPPHASLSLSISQAWFIAQQRTLSLPLFVPPLLLRAPSADKSYNPSLTHTLPCPMFAIRSMPFYSFKFLTKCACNWLPCGAIFYCLLVWWV